MAADHDRESRGFGIEIQLRQIVQHVNGKACDFKHFMFRQLSRPCTSIDVAANCRDRSDCREPLDYCGGADVAGMNDVIRPAQSFDGFRSQQPVSVGDYAD